MVVMNYMYIHVHFSTLFNCMFRHAYCPDSMNLSSLIHISKRTKKSTSDGSNYRAIALGSVIGNILNHIILFNKYCD